MTGTDRQIDGVSEEGLTSCSTH